MRSTSRCFILLLTLGLPLASQAGPQIDNGELDLHMLDMNGAPFRTFHLGLYAKGLDNQHPAAATAMPSDELKQGSSSVLQGDSARYTGVTAAPDSAMPRKPDISPLLNAYDESLLRPIGTY